MWKYLVPETNTWIPVAASIGSSTIAAFDDLVDMVRDHYKANGMAIPDGLVSKIEDQCCKTMGDPRFCIDQYGKRIGKTFGIFNISTVMQGTSTLIDFLAHGRQRTSAEEQNSRASICLSCPMHGDPDGCSACNSQSIKEMVNKIVGGERMVFSSQLKSCRVCGCVLEAAVRVPLEILQRNTSDEQMAQYPDNCWKKKVTP